jgi:hypothetical protein
LAAGILLGAGASLIVFEFTNDQPVSIYGTYFQGLRRRVSIAKAWTLLHVWEREEVRFISRFIGYDLLAPTTHSQIWGGLAKVFTSILWQAGDTVALY